MSEPAARAAARGALAAAVCYACWGLFPIYWKHLASVNAAELIAHRHVWSLGFVLIAMALGSGFRELKAALQSGPALRWHAASGILLTLNWLVYVWGVNHGHVLETSLGYFLVPLINVGLGRLVLHERLRPAQWTAISLAILGVLLMLVGVGRFPWIALTLAVSFGFYGLLRKKSPLGALTGLGLETLLLAPLAIAFLVWQQVTGAGALGRVGAVEHVLLFAAGIVTAIPLLLFAYGARRIRLATLGLLQYIAPTIQFALGVWLYHERFESERAVAFALIWCGLALYTVDNLRAPRQLSPA
jgi:chloramphenicol-sensitive protein RarD